jgi:hypothetical protein
MTILFLLLRTSTTGLGTGQRKTKFSGFLASEEWSAGHDVRRVPFQVKDDSYLRLDD